MYSLDLEYHPNMYTGCATRKTLSRCSYFVLYAKFEDEAHALIFRCSTYNEVRKEVNIVTNTN